jgi:hypothetical protein
MALYNKPRNISLELCRCLNASTALSTGLKAQRNAPIKEVFLLNAKTEMKFYYNIQRVEKKAGQKEKILFCR